MAALQAVDSAAFLVALDPPVGGGGGGCEDPPPNWDAEAKALLHGRGFDR